MKEFKIQNSLLETLRKAFVVSLILFISEVKGDCAMLGQCFGHGKCNVETSTCECYEGWGASSDISFYKVPDCSLRVCPAGKAWSDLPSTPFQAHAMMECSNRGICDRISGVCSCSTGFAGVACERTACPNDCSGHGVCVSLKQMARMSNALPLAPNTYYEGDPFGETWDEDKIFGCVCESSWSVGLQDGERQEPEWFGPDCSMRHCPSNDNPRTRIDETDCSGKYAKNSKHQGEEGNLCHVDCSNLGICDYRTGTCNCFDGSYGPDCSFVDPRVAYDLWEEGLGDAYFSDDDDA